MTIENDVFKLFEMHQGIFYTRLLHEGIQLAVFDHMNRPVAPKALAGILDTHPENTRFFLRGLAAAGLAEARGPDRFANSALSRKYLVTESPSYLGDYLTGHAQWNLPFFEGMSALIRNGPPKKEKQAGDESLWVEQAKGLINFQRACTGPVLVREISAFPEFAGLSRILDLGGGPGLNAAALVHAHPSATARVLDREAVIRVAEQEIEKEGLAHRMDVRPGDFTTDDLGSGYDMVIATACLNFSRDDLEGVMERIHNALNPGGLFVSVHDGLTRDRTRPCSIALSWIPVSMMWQELGLDRGRIARACLRTGFEHVRSQPLAWGLGTMDMDIAKKSFCNQL